MLTRWSDLDRTFGAMDELRRRMDRFFDEYGGDGRYEEGWQSAGWPRVSLYDAGQNLVLKAELPGVGEKEVHLTVNQDVVTLSGERKPDAPEGYSVHRQERFPVKFSRSFTLPTKIDSEKTSASLKDGVLTVTLAKVPESQPRQIAVKAS